MSKEKLSYAQLKEKFGEVKQALKEKKEEFKDFLAENKLKKSEDYSKHKDKNIARTYKDTKKAISELSAKREALEEKLKSAKVEGGKANAKYSYPVGVKSTQDKKKYRSQVRSWAKQLGITVEEFLSNPEKFQKEVESKKESKTEGKKKKKKVKEQVKEEPKKKKKKKKPAPEPKNEEAEAESSEGEDSGEDDGGTDD